MRSALLIALLSFLTVPLWAQTDAPLQEELPAEEIPAETVSDQQVQDRIESVLGEIEAFQSVEIEVRNGVVILGGIVQNARTRESVVGLVERFEGVIWVHDQVSVATDVETRIMPAVDRLERLARSFVAYIPVGLLVVLLIALLWWLGSLLTRWEAPARRLGIDPLIWALFRRVARAGLILVGLIFIFDILGVSTLVGALLGTAGVVGIALGFAFQDIAENYLAGVLMSIRQPFVVNDVIKIGEHEGHVMQMTSRELVLLTFEGNHLRVPNAVVFKSTVINFSRNLRRRFDFYISVGLHEDLSRVADVGREILLQMPGVLNEPPPFVRVMEIEEASVSVQFFAWVNQKEVDLLKVRSEAIRLVKEGLDAAGIEIPERRYEVKLLREGAPGPRPHDEGRHAPGSREIDVAPDFRMDAQVKEELARSNEENLLDRDGG